MKIKLAEALLRRKELQQKVDQLHRLKEADFYETKTGRKAVHEGMDDVIAQVAKISMQQATHAYDTHARALRLCDAAIQQANWTVEIDVDDSVMAEYVDPYVKEK